MNVCFVYNNYHEGEPLVNEANKKAGFALQVAWKQPKVLKIVLRVLQVAKECLKSSTSCSKALSKPSQIRTDPSSTQNRTFQINIL